MNNVSVLPVIKVTIDTNIIFSTPITSHKASINGTEIPYKNRLTAKASAITERSQPNSFSNALIKTPDDEMTIPATIIEKNVMTRINKL